VQEREQPLSQCSSSWTNADRTDFDIVVVGAGPAGLAAACAAAESGKRVGLVDETPWLGGQIWRGQTTDAGEPKDLEPRRWFARFRNSGGILLSGTCVIAAPEPGLLLAEKDGAPLRIGWERLILATGARELFLPFVGWTLPGVLGPGGLQALVKHGWPVEGKRVVVTGSGPLLLAVAAGLRAHRARVVGIFEQVRRSQLLKFGVSLCRYPAKLAQAARLQLGLGGVPYRCNTWPIAAEGDAHVQRVTLTNGRKTWTEGCDYLACGFGLVPNVELPLALGCELKQGFVQVDQWQTTNIPNVYCAGEPTGIGGADCALVEGQIAGYSAAGQSQRAEGLFTARKSWHRFRSELGKAFALRNELRNVAPDETVVCRCEDVSLGRMRRYGDWREAKLQTRCGMGACQGRTCGAAAQFILGWGMESVRPPVLPARVRSLISHQPAETSTAGLASPITEAEDLLRQRSLQSGSTPAASVQHSRQ
jgi:NADPH-dependent 2,4-dienoyl-CoA reductase/sulfur reductase-like enzyme